MRQWLYKLLGTTKRTEIRGGKLWEITIFRGREVNKVELEPPKAEPFVRPEGGAVTKVRDHDIKADDNVTNLTKKPELL